MHLGLRMHRLWALGKHVDAQLPARPNGQSRPTMGWQPANTLSVDLVQVA